MGHDVFRNRRTQPTAARSVVDGTLDALGKSDAMLSRMAEQASASAVAWAASAATLEAAARSEEDLAARDRLLLLAERSRSYGVKQDHIAARMRGGGGGVVPRLEESTGSTGSARARLVGSGGQH